jgi:O-methyltransferase involved in polyketide biosynthesis
MMDLSQVSRTAILTLICRVVASEKENAVFNDPMAGCCLERLISVASAEEKNWILSRRRFYTGISAHDAKAGARRSKVFDDSANRFIADNPHCTVINLGCGFDTRFWRITNENCRYIELDLSEVVALKREILKEQLGYELIGRSILDPSWMDDLTANGNSRFLLLAEGVLPYLPEPDVAHFFRLLAQRFTRSQFVFDTVPVKYLKGIGKMLMHLETKINWGLDASFLFGIQDPREIEAYSPGVKVLGTIKGSAGPVITVSINAPR